MKINALSYAILASTLLIPAKGAFAQDPPPPMPASASDMPATLDAITVTAQRRSESIQEVPMSVTAFSAAALAEMGAAKPADLASATPGMFVSGGRGDQNPIFSIRGISLNDTFSNNNPSVGVYVDEVIQPYTPMMSFQMFDLERVEILKGPQGTLYGRNTSGGAINFITRKPSATTEGHATISYGSYDRLDLEGAFGGPLTDTLAGRVSFKRTRQTDGWQENATTGETIGEADREAGRVQILWTPGDDFDLLVSAAMMSDDSDQQLREHVGFYAADGNGYCAAALAGYRDEGACVDVLGYADPTDDRRTVENSALYGHRTDTTARNYMMKANWYLPAATFSSITSYADYKRVAGDDSDGSPLIQLDSQFTDRIESFTQEFRLASTGDGPLSWTAGLYYSDDSIDGDVLQALDDHFFHTRVDTRWNQSTESRAAFGQLAWRINDRFRLNAGLRYTDETKDYTYDSIDLNPYGDSTLPTPVAGVVSSVDEDDLSGKLGLDYFASERVMLYASAGKGFKSGGFKGAIAFNPAEVEPFTGETVNAYELGAKSSFLGGNLTLNGSVYRYDWRDFQAMVTEIRSGINVIVMSNAGDARVTGAEVELGYRASDALELRASVNVMDTEITRFNAAEGADNYAGNQLTNAPETTFSGSIRWNIPTTVDGWQLYTLLDASYRSKVYYSLANRGQNAQDGYWLTNLRIAATSADGRWEAAVYARNLFDRLYVSQSYDNFGGIFPSQNFLGDPRTVGVSLTYRY